MQDALQVTTMRAQTLNLGIYPIARYQCYLPGPRLIHTGNESNEFMRRVGSPYHCFDEACREDDFSA